MEGSSGVQGSCSWDKTGFVLAGIAVVASELMAGDQVLNAESSDHGNLAQFGLILV